MVVLNADDFTINGEAALILLYPTGIYYTVQAGGMSCDHPKAEGVFLPIGMLDGFDDCSYGCYHLSDKDFDKTILINDINHYLLKELKGQKFSIQIDNDRSAELIEGWWPIVFTGEYFGLNGTFKGYLSEGNCD